MEPQNLSRRSFLMVTAAGLASASNLTFTNSAQARRGAVPVVNGPHAIARESWPPAVIPDHLGIVDRGFTCFSDDFGRLCVIDLRKPGFAPVNIVAEMSGIGKKVVAFKTLGNRGYAAVLRGSDPSEPQPALVSIDFLPVTNPAVASQLSLDKFAEISSLAVSLDLVCVGGTSLSGENLVAIYTGAGKRGRASEPSFLASVTVEAPIYQLDLQDKNLLILEQGQIDYVSLLDPRTPQSRRPLKVEGDFKVMARIKDTAIIAGTAADSAPGSACMVKSLILGTEPHLVAHTTLEPITNVLDAAAQRDRFVVVGETDKERAFISLTYDKTKNLTREFVVSLPNEKSSGFGTKSRILLNNRTAYVASGWSGVSLYNYSRAGWNLQYKYAIPRLPASSIASWGDLVVLAGSDLKLYDIAHLDHPSLVSSADVLSSVKSVVGAGSYVLCLTKDALILRKMDKLSDTVATCKAAGQQVCYDSVQQKAFVLKEQGRKTSLTRVQVYSNSLSADKPFELPGNFARATARGGYLALAALNDITLYGVSQAPEQIGTRHFENLAIRDLVLTDDYIVASAVDQKSKGFLLVLSKDQKNLHVVGTIDLPQDAVALAASKNRVVVVGKSTDGKDLASIVDISSPATPKILATIPAVEAASAVTIKDQVAIVGGRGLAILSLS